VLKEGVSASVSAMLLGAGMLAHPLKTATRDTKVAAMTVRRLDEKVDAKEGVCMRVTPVEKLRA